MTSKRELLVKAEALVHAVRWLPEDSDMNNTIERQRAELLNYEAKLKQAEAQGLEDADIISRTTKERDESRKFNKYAAEERGRLAVEVEGLKLTLTNERAELAQQKTLEKQQLDRIAALNVEVGRARRDQGEAVRRMQREHDMYEGALDMLKTDLRDAECKYQEDIARLNHIIDGLIAKKSRKKKAK